jgi:hypothetical protein
MAQKDWKKQPTRKGVPKEIYRNAKKDLNLKIEWYEGWKGFHVLNRFGYWIHRKFTKTKAQALKEAKAYMRKH